jgi:hypothetical protein
MMSTDDACTDLAFTGLGYSVMAIVVVAIACLAVGMVILGRKNSRGHLGVFVALLLVLGACTGVGMASSSPARAATPGCTDATPTPSTTPAIVQTSTITELAPGGTAAGISGVSTNLGQDSVFVVMVEVHIASVTKAPNAAAGSCDASDYVVLNPQMPVDQSVPPQGSVQFTGATIGFNDRSTNQDACKGATVRLIYELYES